MTLRCEADGVPRPAVTWLKDGRPITDQRGARVLNEGRLLQVTDAKVSDTGRYTCVAVNVAGQADSKHDVNVHGEGTRLGQRAGLTMSHDYIDRKSTRLNSSH